VLHRTSRVHLSKPLCPWLHSFVQPGERPGDFIHTILHKQEETTLLKSIKNDKGWEEIKSVNNS
jgi:hypothetical protein